MPTPFSHLVIADRLRSDPALPAPLREQIARQRPAFWLGSVVADGHGEAGLKRQDTHFYTYDRPIETAPWRVMLTRYPTLNAATDEAQRVFVAGYLAHLAVDEVWATKMSAPCFANPVPHWGTRTERFLMLNVLLMHMDERDRALLDGKTGQELEAATPHGWLPFMPDAALNAWNQVIYRQLLPGGHSESLDIIAPRVGQTAADLRALLDDAAGMERDLWAHVPRETWQRVEAEMYAYAREVLAGYLGDEIAG